MDFCTVTGRGARLGLFGLTLLLGGPVRAESAAPVLLAIDADFGVRSSTSAQAIQLGATIAADEINAAGGVLGGRPLRIITRNNNSGLAGGTRGTDQ